jgi:hypothetical protein
MAAAVHQHQTADGAGNADNMFQSCQSGLLGSTGEAGDPDPRLRVYPFSRDVEAGKVLAEAQDDAAHAGVAEKEIAPLTDDDAGEIVLMRNATEALNLGDILRLDKKVGGTTDAPGAVIPQGRGKGTETNIESGEFFQEGASGGVGHGQAAIVNKKRGRRLLAPLFAVGSVAIKPEGFR